MATLTLQPDAAAGKDNFIEQATPTSNNGTATTLDVIMTGGATPRRGLLEFDITSIPSGSTVTSATLSLFTSNGLTNVNTSIHRVTQAWTEAGSTWNKYDGITDWTSAGGDYDATADANATPSSTAAGTQTDFDIKALVQEWVDGTANYGMLVKITTESGNTTGHQFASSDNATAGYRPKLVVNYSPSGGLLLSAEI